MDHYSFNLVDRPWIPVLTLQGQVKDVNLKEALVNSHEYQAIVHQSPLVCAALYRLLLAVLHRALKGPSHLEEAVEIFKGGRFPESEIESYLSSFYPRFELFAKEGAFFQVSYSPEFEGKKVPWMSLAAETATGNNPVFFAHTWDDYPRPLGASEAARLLVANQTFALGGGVSPFDLKNRADGPAASGMLVISHGDNLFQTLAYNLLDYPETFHGKDIPVWEEEPITLEKLRKNQAMAAAGHVQRYSWLSRLVYLFPEGSREAPFVRYMAYASGRILLAGQGLDLDPMIPYRVDKKKGYLPLRPQPERALWRDYVALVPVKSNHYKRASTILRGRAVWEKLDRKDTLKVYVFAQGRVPGKAKLEFWHTALFPIPSKVLEKESLVEFLYDIESLAGEVEKTLWKSGSYLARELLSLGQGSPSADDVKALVKTLPLSQAYWPELERSFYELLERVARGQDEDKLMEFWAESLEKAAKKAWSVTVRSVGTTARALRAVSKVSPRFYGTLKGVLTPQMD